MFQPITILASLPLSIGGVIVALLVTGNSVSMPVVIGILMLMGIVTKNAIMLVDFAVEAEARGASRDEAIIDAGRKRARPIVMTTIAMIAGMIPSALGLGQGGEFRAPMAIAVIGGLTASTVLSLMFVPSFYTIMDDVGRFFARVFGRFIGPTEELEAEHAPPLVGGDAGAAVGGGGVRQLRLNEPRQPTASTCRRTAAWRRARAGTSRRSCAGRPALPRNVPAMTVVPTIRPLRMICPAARPRCGRSRPWLM